MRIYISRDGIKGTGNSEALCLWINKPKPLKDYRGFIRFAGKSGVILSSEHYREIENGRCYEFRLDWETIKEVI